MAYIGLILAELSLSRNDSYVYLRHSLISYIFDFVLLILRLSCCEFSVIFASFKCKSHPTTLTHNNVGHDQRESIYHTFQDFKPTALKNFF